MYRGKIDYGGASLVLIWNSNNASMHHIMHSISKKWSIMPPHNSKHPIHNIEKHASIAWHRPRLRTPHKRSNQSPIKSIITLCSILSPNTFPTIHSSRSILKIIPNKYPWISFPNKIIFSMP